LTCRHRPIHLFPHSTSTPTRNGAKMTKLMARLPAGYFQNSLFKNDAEHGFDNWNRIDIMDDPAEKPAAEK